MATHPSSVASRVRRAPIDYRRDKHLTTITDLASPELIASIRGAALADAAFAAVMLNDPKGAYRQRFGSELFPGYDIKVERTGEGSALLSVPGVEGAFFARISETDELSDTELEYVSAGTTH